MGVVCFTARCATLVAMETTQLELLEMSVTGCTWTLWSGLDVSVQMNWVNSRTQVTFQNGTTGLWRVRWAHSTQRQSRQVNMEKALEEEGFLLTSAPRDAPSWSQRATQLPEDKTLYPQREGRSPYSSKQRVRKSHVRYRVHSSVTNR